MGHENSFRAVTSNNVNPGNVGGLDQEEKFPVCRVLFNDGCQVAPGMIEKDCYHFETRRVECCC